MISNFTSHVNSVISSKSAELEAKLYNHQDKIKEIERKLDSGKITSRADAMKELKNLFSDYLSSDEYRRIDDNAKYDIA